MQKMWSWGHSSPLLIIIVTVKKLLQKGRTKQLKAFLGGLFRQSIMLLTSYK